jgi:hypothetical protein
LRSHSDREEKYPASPIVGSKISFCYDATIRRNNLCPMPDLPSLAALYSRSPALRTCVGAWRS